ncbi:DUF2911 domain-containing protein [Fulvivirga kasyanovii]|uniref:DUF2911 domain-containing protein n=1 Tax=Fulvivirga kasyanovii TaxID=396812 RepID=A0ABW9RWW0_9BACT|nr:DUF2911 domain-containing protein [Fulvivirga kasyanovii]MTI27500.1 DUF2911 domain-containing protein [Fulvivirga kasyanovii]
MRSKILQLFVVLLSVCLFHQASLGQGVTLPQVSPAAEVMQQVGISNITINYSRPNVVSPQGEDRTGKVWGTLVPYGFNNLGFGTAKASPWRAGANENTTIEFSHDVKIEGKDLQAGKYGLHMAIAEDGTVTIIFSKSTEVWGSYFYDEKDDALRVSVQWEDHEATPLLTYNFVEVTDRQAVIALDWEKKRIPFKAEFDTPELVFQNLQNELHSSPGFTLSNWNAAIGYLVQNNIHLDEALNWANNAIEGQFFSEENFRTLQMKSMVLAAMGKNEEAAKVMNQALDNPTAAVADYYTYGRQLIAQDKDAEALEVFKKASKKWKDHWLAPHGLARGYSALGQYDKALKLERDALAKAPENSKVFLEGYIKTLEQQKDFN